MDNVALEEQWTDDLWWAFNWGAATEVLQGAINLAAGFHKLEVIGFEGCCDGGITVQYRRLGGTFQTFTTGTINITSRKCPVTEPTYAIGPTASQLASLNITQTSTVLEDPFNALLNPKAISGARVKVSNIVSNIGPASTDNDSVLIINVILADMSLYVSGSPFVFTDGAGANASGLSFSYTGLGSVDDDVDFSNDNAATFNYVPTAAANGADATATYVRITPKGQMNCADGATPSCNLEYELIVD